MSNIWKEEESRLKPVFGIPDDYQLYCAGDSVDSLMEERLPDSQDLIYSYQVLDMVENIKAPKGYMVCLFMNAAGEHLIVTPTYELFAGKTTPS